MIPKGTFYKFVITGAPGCGKGTISSWLVRDFKLKHLSAGDLLRQQITLKTDDGKEAEQLVKQGKLVPDHLVTRLVTTELKKLTGHHWLLDGFPRNLIQAQQLDKLFRVDGVIDLFVPPDEIVKRVSGRLIHPASGRVYNMEYNPPKVTGKDDVTGDDLIQREDDKEATVRSRLQTYEKSTKPILTHYDDQKLLIQLKGITSDAIYTQLKAHLLKHYYWD